MLDRNHFTRDSKLIVEWIDDYLRNIKDLPVKSKVRPGEIKEQIGTTIPARGESLEKIMQDFKDVILPGMVHWQHPNFHAYFNANNSTESILAEMLTSALGAQCMIWETSPAAAELEERMLDWLKDAMGLPRKWEGVIQDTASTATLAAILTARERKCDFQSNYAGVPANLRVYCSQETHSSIDKAVAIAGIGKNNLIKIQIDGQRRMDPAALKAAIEQDISDGLKPTAVVLTLGTTGTMAIDNIKDVGPICKKYGVWLHVDAAYAGTALLLAEHQGMIEGIAYADSFVFNPHKWMFTNFDCTAYYVKSADHLIKTFEILPEYLKTHSRGQVNDYRDWGVPLGRRFRALKLWFVMRSYGLKGLRDRIRQHIKLSRYFVKWLESQPHLELITAPVLNFSCFRYNPSREEFSFEDLNKINATILEKINSTGKAYLSHTTVDGRYAIRVVIGQTYIQTEDVDRLIDVIKESLP
ncbi:MAG: aspartate aminotransferase family protein [Saprospiraceae bacterium]|nr:aspartate aminotransferase family protein [Saprospiraceae bacterium]